MVSLSIGAERNEDGRRSEELGQFVPCYTMLEHSTFDNPERRFQPHVLRYPTSIHPSCTRGPLVQSDPAADGVRAWRSCPDARHHKQAEWLRLLYGASSEGLEYARDRRRHRGQRQTGVRQGLWLSRL